MHNATLKILDLQDARISGALAEGLSHNSTLSSLNLNHKYLVLKAGDRSSRRLNSIQRSRVCFWQAMVLATRARSGLHGHWREIPQ